MIELRNRIGATLHLPATISWRRVPLSIGIPTVANAHGDGAIVVGRPRVDARQFSLSGSIFYPNRQQIRDAADNLLQFLQHPPIEVFRVPGSNRRLYVYPQGASQDWMDAGAELVIDVPMLAPDPYWYGIEETYTEADAGIWQIDVDGNAHTYPAITIEVTQPGSNPTLTNASTGQEIALGGSYLQGDIITIYTARYHAELNDQPIIDRLGDEFVAKGFALQPGSNALQYTGPAADVTLTYRPRWY